MKHTIVQILFSVLNQISRLSWKNAFRLSDFLCWALFSVFGYRKKVIWQNLKNSFPEKSDAELQCIAKDFYLHFTDLIVETIKFRTASPECVRERLQGDISVMDDFYDSNTNLIYLMGHRGNWELANLFALLYARMHCGLQTSSKCSFRPMVSGFENTFWR
jgi:KDO2-lipid IV(A) lauroyltransferase